MFMANTNIKLMNIRRIDNNWIYMLVISTWLTKLILSFEQRQKTKQELDALLHRENQKDKADLLRFQIDELTTLALEAGEMQVLNEEHQLLHHARDYLQHAQQITHCLNADDSIMQLLSDEAKCCARWCCDLVVICCEDEPGVVAGCTVVRPRSWAAG